MGIRDTLGVVKSKDVLQPKPQSLLVARASRNSDKINHFSVVI